MPIQPYSEDTLPMMCMAPQETTWEDALPVAWPDLNDIASMPGASDFDEEDLTSEMSIDKSGRWIVY